MSKYSKIESLENWVAWMYLRGTLKWPAKQIAYELEVNEQRLIEWVNARTTAMNNQAKAQTGKVAEIEAQLKKRFAEKDTDEDIPTYDVKRVVKMLIDGFNLPEIAEKLKADRSQFLYWYNANLQLIHNAWKRAKRN